MKAHSLIKAGALGACAALSILSFSAHAQTDSAAGGSAGDGDVPTTYTKKSFTELDLNKNGRIDAKEASTAKLDGALVKKMDANKDGEVTQAEFDAYMATQPTGTQLPKVTK